MFFGLHRLEVLQRPQYARLQIGVVEGQEEMIKPLASDELSCVPYAEPTWLNEGYFSPYYKESHRKFQRAVRKFAQEVLRPEAVECEDTGRRISQEVIDKFWYVAYGLGAGTVTERRLFSAAPTSSLCVLDEAST